MIYTVTLNPSLDYLMFPKHFNMGLTNRSQREELYVGGKGINVSMVLKELGQPTTVLGMIAGFTGDAIEMELENLGISTGLVQLADGFSRINVKLKSETETEINGAGPRATQEEFQQLVALLDDLKAEDYLVLSGSLPAGLTPDCYATLLQRATQKGGRVVVDAAGETLRKLLPYGPFLIKPNRQELEELLGISLDPQDTKQIVNAAKQLQQEGATNVLVSLGGDGCLLLDEQGQVHRMTAAEGTPINTVGAGDSMVAGFLTGYIQTHDYGKALRLGTACGGATAFSQGLATSERIQKVLNTLPQEESL